MAMTLDDYRAQIKKDIKEYLTDEDLWPTAEPGTSEYDDQYDKAYDQCWIADSVTGNASGSYTFNTWQAAENVSHLLWDEDLWLLINGDMSVKVEDIEEGPEHLDVLIRCSLLSECLNDVLREKREQPGEN